MSSSTSASPSGRADLFAGVRQGVLLGAAALVLTLPPTGLATLRSGAAVVPAAQLSTPIPGVASPREFRAPEFRPPEFRPPAPRLAEFAGASASHDARYIADWIADSRDNAGMPFAILDKRDARVHLFDRDARLVASSPVLLGAAPGDDSVAGIGSRPIHEVRPEERTTPAGRFVSTPGRNAGGETVVWVDYDAAVSMHRVRPIDPKERRLERLASNDPSERRISYGCINVPVAFFDAVVQPVLGSKRGIVYVLPETRHVKEAFALSYSVAEKHSSLMRASLR